MEVFPSERRYKGLFSERKGAGMVCGHSAACPVQTEARSGVRASETSPGTEWPRVPEPRSLVPLPTGYEHSPGVPQSPCEFLSFLGFQDTAIWVFFLFPCRSLAGSTSFLSSLPCGSPRPVPRTLLSSHTHSGMCTHGHQFPPCPEEPFSSSSCFVPGLQSLIANC